VEPGQTGPVADVLYSAAGNSGDELWYENGIFGWDFEIGTSFQPQWPEAHNVAMEFSNGLYELVKIARDYAADGQPLTSELTVRTTAAGATKIKFLADEPATVYYRLDGRRPTYDNATMYVGAGDREGGQSITLAETTTVTWFAVDAAGNVENNYKPDPGSVSNLYRRQTVTVPAAGEAPVPEQAEQPDPVQDVVVEEPSPAPATVVTGTTAPAAAPAAPSSGATVKRAAARKVMSCRTARRKAARGSKAAKRRVAKCRAAAKRKAAAKRRG